MTVVVGFNWPVEHDNSIAVVVDGELVFASEEERWTRHKHSPAEPSINALKQAFKYLKSKYGIKPKEVDAYAVNFDFKLMTYRLKLGNILNTALDFIGIKRFGIFGIEVSLLLVLVLSCLVMLFVMIICRLLSI